ncbi:MAG TPA: NYN domain-containing protein, partial [Anaerolineales bacterium]|nr:NYN domain-containing protein [Anaerolineales bacterium]
MTSQLAVFIDFENVALWAEREFFDFELTPLMEYLQARGPAVVKRAYGDWSRFSRYRDELMNHSIDLIQIFSVRAGKNRTDIRMAIDAMEVAMHRPQIDTFVIVSGDSDFGPLVAKLREYGRYTLGIGPRSVTHHLLVKSCDEFVYLETVMGETIITGDHTSAELDTARSLLRKALQVHGQRGDIPVLATRLKQTMLLMDPAFNEANFGYSQFKAWLEDSRDHIKLFLKDLQLFVAPLDYQAAGYNEFGADSAGMELVEKVEAGSAVLEDQYRQLFARLRLTSVDLETRRDVLRDVYREVSEHPYELSVDDLLETLDERYEEQGLMRSKANLREIIQMAYRQNAFTFDGQPPSQFNPVNLAKGIETEAEFISWSEEDFIFALVRAGVELDIDVLANLMLNDSAQADYVQCLLDDLHARGMIIRRGKHYVIAEPSSIPFRDDPALQVLMDDLQQVEVPDGM